MKPTMSLPMSWMSPRTVPKTTMPSFLVWSCLGGQAGFQDLADLTQHLAAHDELGQEVGAFLVAFAHHLHGL